MSNNFVMSAVFLCLSIAIFETSSVAADRLIVISPHRKSLQDEVIPRFKKHYQDTYKSEVEVEWLDQGGTSDDMRFVASKFAGGKKSAQIDVFWGGGTGTFEELRRDGYLARYDLPKLLDAQLPPLIAGVPMRDISGQSWYGAAASSFGIFYNKVLLEKINKLRPKDAQIPEPRLWEDLGRPEYFGMVSAADPRRSGSANTVNSIIVQGLGWEKGWELLTSTAANTRKFTHSSSDPIRAVSDGDSLAAMAIDFYAAAKLDDHGPAKLGFTLPEGQTIVDPDPIAILRGAPNRLTAERFLQYVLSKEAQSLLVLSKGDPEGPSQYFLGRIATNSEVYKSVGKRARTQDPFLMKKSIEYDAAKAGKLKRVFDDLIGAILIDTHSELKKAWESHIKRGDTGTALAYLSKPPITEEEAIKLSDRWEDDVFRNQTINAWVQATRLKYKNAALGL